MAGIYGLLNLSDTDRSFVNTVGQTAVYEAANAYLNAHTTDSQAYAAVAGAANGTFLVTWVSYGGQDGDGRGVFGRRVCRKGDANGDGLVTVADVFLLINFLFAAGPAPAGCSGDANGDLEVTVADVFHLINFLFAAGPPPF